MNPQIRMVVVCITLCCGCSGMRARTAEWQIRQTASLTQAADWKSERAKEPIHHAYYHFAGEAELIACGQAAMPYLHKLLYNFDHRLRCVGITVMLEVARSATTRRILVEHLDDPYLPIREKCMSELWWMGWRDLPSIVNKTSVAEWKALKELCEQRLKENEDK